jgi:hypothetical protein
MNGQQDAHVQATDAVRSPHWREIAACRLCRSFDTPERREYLARRVADLRRDNAEAARDAETRALRTARRDMARTAPWGRQA